MMYSTATTIIGLQNKWAKALNGKRFEYKGYEYRIKISTGFIVTASLDRREKGRRNFKYYGLVDLTHCLGAKECGAAIGKFVKNKEG